MARTIKEIQGEIIAELTKIYGNLSTSGTAQWRTMIYVVAVAIHTFEVILDAFKTETEIKTRMITPGTERWYAEMCRRWQVGHNLVFDPVTAMCKYEVYDPAAQIIKVVAVTNRAGLLVIKVAKISKEGKVEHLSQPELAAFTAYIRQINVFGVNNSITSTTPDSIRYNVQVYYDTAYLESDVRERVEAAVETFKGDIGFDGLFYPQKFIDQIMHVSGVLTVKPIKFECKAVTDAAYTTVGTWSELIAGYFDYDKGSVLTFSTVDHAG